jgi:hypothetical protein
LNRQARNAAKQVCRQFQLAQERSLLQVQNKQSYFKYLNTRLDKRAHDTIRLSNDDKIRTGAEAAEAQNAEFSRNFSISCNANMSVNREQDSVSVASKVLC